MISYLKPSEIIFENDFVVAVLDIHPVAKGHTLIIPKKHSTDISDTDDKILSEIMLVIKIVGKILLEKYDATGFNVLNANGQAAQQSIAHLHFHLVPRKENDQLDLWIKPKP